MAGSGMQSFTRTLGSSAELQNTVPKSSQDAKTQGNRRGERWTILWRVVVRKASPPSSHAWIASVTLGLQSRDGLPVIKALLNKP